VFYVREIILEPMGCEINTVATYLLYGCFERCAMFFAGVSCHDMCFRASMAFRSFFLSFIPFTP
jgi:hypothetical protein